MACKICNRNNCSPCFHSIEDQEAYQEIHGDCEEKIDRLEAKIIELEAEIEKLGTA